MSEPEELIAKVVGELYPTGSAEAARQIVTALDDAGWEILPRVPDDIARTAFDVARRATEGK